LIDNRNNFYPNDIIRYKYDIVVCVKTGNVRVQYVNRIDKGTGNYDIFIDVEFCFGKTFNGFSTERC